MDKTKHTPGPWKLNGGVYTNDAGTHCASIFSLGDAEVRPATAHGDDAQQAAANARLIAAAPDLLIACETIIHAARLNDPTAGAVAATLAMHAIEKAVGKNNEIMLGENNA